MDAKLKFRKLMDDLKTSKPYKQREFQLIALGILLASPNRLDEIDEGGFLEGDIKKVVEHLHKIRGNDEGADIEILRSFLRERGCPWIEGSACDSVIAELKSESKMSRFVGVLREMTASSSGVYEAVNVQPGEKEAAITKALEMLNAWGESEFKKAKEING